MEPGFAVTIQRNKMEYVVVELSMHVSGKVELRWSKCYSLQLVCLLVDARACSLQRLDEVAGVAGTFVVSHLHRSMRMSLKL